MNRRHRDELEQQLERYDAEDLREIVLELARHDMCGVMSTLRMADWHIDHGDVCSRHLPALEQHHERAKRRAGDITIHVDGNGDMDVLRAELDRHMRQMLRGVDPETGRIGAGCPAAPVRHGGGAL